MSAREVFRRFLELTEQSAYDQLADLDAVVVHETRDPETIVAEFALHHRLIESGATVAPSFVMIMTVRDGLIVHSRDYGNPLAGAKALGRLDQSVAAYC